MHAVHTVLACHHQTCPEFKHCRMQLTPCCKQFRPKAQVELLNAALKFEHKQCATAGPSQPLLKRFIQPFGNIMTLYLALTKMPVCSRPVMIAPGSADTFLQQTALSCAWPLGLQICPPGVQLLVLLGEVLIDLLKLGLLLRICVAQPCCSGSLDIWSKSSVLVSQLLQLLLQKIHSAHAAGSLSNSWRKVRDQCSRLLGTISPSGFAYCASGFACS